MRDNTGGGVERVVNGGEYLNTALYVMVNTHTHTHTPTHTCAHTYIHTHTHTHTHSHTHTHTHRYLSWANYLYTVQVKTVQTARPPPAARRPGQGLSSSSHPFTRLLTIAVFNILPLELLICFSVDRHVCSSTVVHTLVFEIL